MNSTSKPNPMAHSIFSDLGFAPEEAENLRLRSELMIRLSRILEKRSLTQSQAAKLLGVSQPRICDLLKGKISKFSIDTLIAMLGHAGARVQLTVTRRRKAA